jgi:hypothetical protein
MIEDRESRPDYPGPIRGPHRDRVVERLAAQQHGVVARRQLLAAGLASSTVDDRIASGHLVPLHRGVYAVGHRSLCADGWWMAAVLAVGPGAVLSHRDAAQLHGLGSFGGSRIDVSTAAERRGTSKIRVHGRRRLDARDVTTVEGIEVTAVARTLVDLAEVVTRDRLLKACSEAERQRTLDVEDVEEALGRRRGRRGPATSKLRAALAELESHGATLTRSPLEDRFLSLLDAHDLPRPATNAYVEGFEGDAVWRKQRLVVELDGWDAHKTRRAFQRDRTKTNALTAQGWTVLRFTHDDVTRRPHETAAAIAAQLSRAA